ncbi:MULTISPECIES: hypothetical protein [Thermomonosporaceae]|uniref:hypothetical protein n=1 Tax=Thermomonosporaceae TaxID=2012 RepID=UPI00255ABDB9|nr:MULTISPECIES: hypothetical protein [Thermomonosporaceae]MDL4775867.1 hypothetical protein [Actinomadura xylanilytica]
MFKPRASADPPEFYAWDADRAGGVTDDRGRAVNHVNEVLADAPPDTSGLVRRVQVGAVSGDYVTLGVVGVARRDGASGSVVWTDGESGLVGAR